MDFPKKIYITMFFDCDGEISFDASPDPDHLTMTGPGDDNPRSVPVAVYELVELGDLVKTHQKVQNLKLVRISQEEHPNAKG